VVVDGVGVAGPVVVDGVVVASGSVVVDGVVFVPGSVVADRVVVGSGSVSVDGDVVVVVLSSAAVSLVGVTVKATDGF
jgi:hypothetical protein